MKKCLLFILVLFFSFLFNITFAQSGWTAQINPLGTDTIEIGKVQFVSPTEGWISVGNGEFLHTTDAGTNWLVVTPFPDDTVWCPSDAALSMSWVNPTHGWQINSIGKVFGISYGVVIHQTTDGGNTWQKKTLSTTYGAFAVQIQFVDVNNGWLLMFDFSTQAPTFLRTTDGGNNWVPFSGAGIFYFADANTGWAFYGSGMNGAEPPYYILQTVNGGTDWAYQYMDNTVGQYNAIYFSDLQHGWVVGDSGKVVKTTDGGTNWIVVTNSGINPNHRSKSVFFLDANNGWISSKDASGNGIVQHTTNGGASWETQETPLQNQDGNRIFSLYFVDAQHGWLTAGSGRICAYTGTTSTGSDNENIGTFSLAQNYPNPFNPCTKIYYSVPVSSQIRIMVYDVLGNEIETLVNEEKPAGTYQLTWNATNLASGIYFYRIQAGSFIDTKKMILIK